MGLLHPDGAITAIVGETLGRSIDMVVDCDLAGAFEFTDDLIQIYDLDTLANCGNVEAVA